MMIRIGREDKANKADAPHSDAQFLMKKLWI